MLDLCQGSSMVERAFNMDWRGDSITYTKDHFLDLEKKKKNRLTHRIGTH